MSSLSSALLSLFVVVVTIKDSRKNTLIWSVFHLCRIFPQLFFCGLPLPRPKPLPGQGYHTHTHAHTHTHTSLLLLGFSSLEMRCRSRWLEQVAMMENYINSLLLPEGTLTSRLAIPNFTALNRIRTLIAIVKTDVLTTTPYAHDFLLRYVLLRDVLFASCSTADILLIRGNQPRLHCLFLASYHPWIETWKES